MDVSRILPDLQSSLVCEDIRQETSGNFILIGVVGFLRVPKIPITAFRLCIFNRWTAGVGQFLEEVRLIAPDQVTVIRKAQVKFQLKDAAHHATNVSVLGQIEFKQPGVYFIEVVVDDVMKLRYPFPVVVVQQQQGPEGGAPNPGDNPQPTS